MTQRISLAIEQWMALRQGGAEAPPIWFTVVGGSMRPLIRVNRDKVMLVSVQPEEIRVGDIVLFPGHFRGGEYCLHRVWKLDGDRVQTFGDGNPKPDNWFPRSRILGKAKLIKRGKQTIDCDDPKVQRRAARWCALWRFRPLLLLPHRLVDKIEREWKKTRAYE
jgi:signal peptidase I